MIRFFFYFTKDLDSMLLWFTVKQNIKFDNIYIYFEYGLRKVFPLTLSIEYRIIDEFNKYD